MQKEDIAKLIPTQGFIKIPSPGGVTLHPERKVQLIRKANQLFSQGKIEEAGRIFLTTGNTDGLTRVGDYYYQKGEFLEALRMYKVAPQREKVEKLVLEMANVIRFWLQS